MYIYNIAGNSKDKKKTGKSKKKIPKEWAEAHRKAKIEHKKHPNVPYVKQYSAELKKLK